LEVKYGNTVLFDFEAVIDIDYSIVTFLRDISNQKYIRPSIIEADYNFLKSLILTRRNNNPLSVLLSDEYLNSIDDIYNSLLKNDNYYDQIIRLSEHNDVFKLMQTYRKTLDGVIKCDVLCHNHIQEGFIKSVDSTINTILKNKEENFNVKRYDSIFIKYYPDVLKFDKLEGKHIFLLNYQFNLEENTNKIIPKLDISFYVTDVNKVYMVDPYIDFKLPEKIIERKDVHD